LSRSARGRLTGVNTQKISGDRVSDLALGTILIYDESAAFIPEIRQRVPDTLIVLRLIRNSWWDDPERTAREGARLCREFPQTDLLIPGNEFNYEVDAPSAAIARWCDRFNDQWALEGAPKHTISPAMSTGRPFDLRAVRNSWRRFDYIGVHAYATLDDLGHTAALANIAHHRDTWPDKEQVVSEHNVEKLEETTFRHSEGAAAVESFLNRLVALGYVKAAHWFLDDSDSWPYRLVRIPPLLDLYRRLGHEQADGPAPGPIPPWPTPPSGEIARIEAIYNIAHTDGSEFVLKALEERTDPPNISALGPADAEVVIVTADNQHRASGMGRADMPFSHPAQYQPVSQGEAGFYDASCGDSRVTGLGWAYDKPPTMQGPHTNVVPTFARRGTSPPKPQPPTGQAWQGAFLAFSQQHPEVGQPLGVAVYAPSDWACCIQVSASHCLCWNGWVVTSISRS
jgi:hypothetical protein